MFKNLSIKQALVGIIGLLFISGILLEVEARFAGNQHDEIRLQWLNFEIERSEKARLHTSLLAALGYGGLIHNFKDFILRQDENDANKARNDFGAARAIITQYLTVQTESEELIALHDLGNTLDDYSRALTRAEMFIQETESDPTSLDLESSVDDELALRALETLGQVIDREFGDDRSTGKPRLAAQLRRLIGYGGFIHNFKNFILRQDARYANRTRQGLSSARRVLREWRGLGITHGEELALQDLDTVFAQYGVLLEDAEKMARQGLSVQDIDEATRVDDYRALRGLSVLDREIATQIERDFKVVEERYETLAYLDDVRKWSVRGLIGALIVASTLLVYTMIIRPLRKIQDAMTKLASGDLGVDIPGHEMQNEIGSMARAIDVFKETAQRYSEAKEELEFTVMELTDTKSRLEEQAADLAETAESLELERQRVEKLSITDRLTGLHNRQKLDQTIAEEVKRAQRYSHPLSLIIFDIDHFKKVNDTHGHLVGDQVLTLMAEVLRESIRGVDIAGRWGGEEFLVVCPETDENGSVAVAEKIREAIKSTDFPTVGQKTASFGVAEFQKNESIESLIHRADEALYTAKRLGRNRVEFAT